MIYNNNTSDPSLGGEVSGGSRGLMVRESDS